MKALVLLVLISAFSAPAFAFNNIGDNYGMPGSSSAAELARNLNRGGAGSDARGSNLGENYGMPGASDPAELARYINWGGAGSAVRNKRLGDNYGMPN